MFTTTGIYEIRNLVNGKRYVGSAVDFGNRWRVHAQSLARGDHHSTPLQRAWRRYGPSAFQFNKLLACSKDNLIMYEQICMDALAPEYNVAPVAGSQLGYRHAPESRAKMSAANNRLGNPGYVHTPQSKARISENRKGKGGGARTPERLAKIGAAHRGRPKSEQHRAKLSASLMGHTQTAEQIEKRMSSIRALNAKSPNGKPCFASRAQLTPEQVTQIRSALLAGETHKSLADRFGICRAAISKIKARKSYAWVL